MTSIPRTSISAGSGLVIVGVSGLNVGVELGFLVMLRRIF
jgi:hypothetical protein